MHIFRKANSLGYFIFTEANHFGYLFQGKSPKQGQIFKLEQECLVHLCQDNCLEYLYNKSSFKSLLKLLEHSTDKATALHLVNSSNAKQLGHEIYGMTDSSYKQNSEIVSS